VALPYISVFFCLCFMVSVRNPKEFFIPPLSGWLGFGGDVLGFLVGVGFLVSLGFFCL